MHDKNNSSTSKVTEIVYLDLTSSTHICTVQCGSLLLPSQLSMDAIEFNNVLYTIEYKVNVLDNDSYKIYVKRN